MLDFVKLVFGGFFNVILWVILIGSAITGGISGYGMGWHNVGYAFLGVIIGLIVGLWVNVVLGGFVATILNIGKNMEILAEKLSNTDARNTLLSLEKISSSPFHHKQTKKCSKCEREVDEDYSACPHCGNDVFK